MDSNIYSSFAHTGLNIERKNKESQEGYGAWFNPPLYPTATWIIVAERMKCTVDLGGIWGSKEAADEILLSISLGVLMFLIS